MIDPRFTENLAGDVAHFFSPAERMGSQRAIEGRHWGIRRLIDFRGFQGKSRKATLLV